MRAPLVTGRGFTAFDTYTSAPVVIVNETLMNRHRDKKYGPSNKEASDEAGMRDHTEFQNKDFRYVL